MVVRWQCYDPIHWSWPRPQLELQPGENEELKTNEGLQDHEIEHS